MAYLATYNRHFLKSAVVVGMTLGLASLGFATLAQAGDVLRPGGNGGFSHGGNFGSHGGNPGGFRGGQGFGGGQRFGAGQHFGAGQNFGGGQHFGGGQQFGGGQHFGGGQRFVGGQRVGRIAPAYNNGVASGYRTGRYAWTGARRNGWSYGGYGLGAGLALGTGLGYGASAYPYDYGYNDGYAAPDYAYEADPGVAGAEYGDNIDPQQDGDGGAWDSNGTHYTCSPYEKKTRLQRRACGAS